MATVAKTATRKPVPARPVPARPKVLPTAPQDDNTITGTVGGAEDQDTATSTQGAETTPQFRWTQARLSVLADAMVNRGLLTTSALVTYLQSHPACAADAHLLTPRKIGVAVGRLIDAAAEKGFVFPRLKHPGLTGGPRIDYDAVLSGLTLPEIEGGEGEEQDAE